MMKNFKHLLFLTLGVFLLMSGNALAAKNECYSDSEFKDFKTLYIKLQNQLNYEAKDAYLDKNMQVQLKPHAKNTPYPGKEFESALFGEYQNSLRKIGKLYQDAKYEGDENFKSNEVLVNFMKAIDDKSSDSEEFIKKTKIKDVIDALEEASKNKYAKSSDKKFIITSGDKYLLEKLLTHAQDRVCSVSKFEQTNKGTALFKADYLQKVKNAPLNMLVNTIKNAPIEKDSKIDLKPASNLTADLVDTDIAIKSAITDNVNQLSAWVKKVKSKGAACLAAIKTKSFANNIQGQVQGCNFGHFMETLGEDNVSNLESVLHFINANERLLNRNIAKAETNLDELKLEGFIGNTFSSLGTEIKCTMIDSANSGDKKVFIRNLPYDEKLNKYDTSGITCKTSSKLLGADTCKKQFDLVSDSFGRGIELKPKTNVDQNLIFSINDAKSCSNIAVKDLKSASDSSNSQGTIASEEMCMAQFKEGMAYTWNSKTNKCSEVIISAVNSIEQCMALKKQGKVFNWDGEKKSCNEFSFLILGAALKQSEQMCEVKKREGFSFKWNDAEKLCQQSTTLSSSAVKSLEACEAKSKDGFKWSMLNKTCDQLPILSASEQKSKELCEAQSNNSASSKWDTQNKKCLTGTSGSSGSNTIGDLSGTLSDSEKQAKLACEAKALKWDIQNKMCTSIPADFKTAANESKNKLACETKSSSGITYKWDSVNQSCSRSPSSSDNGSEGKEGNKSQTNTHSNTPLDANEKQMKLACEMKSGQGLSYKWNSVEKSCTSSSAASQKNDEEKSPIILSSGGSTANTGNGSSSTITGSKESITPDTSEELKTPPSNNNSSQANEKPDLTSGSKTGSNSNLSQLPNRGENNNSGSKQGLNSDNKSPMLNQNKTPSAEQIKCEEKKKDSMAYIWMFKEKECVELPISDAKAKCEGQQKTGFTYTWLNDGLKCEEKAIDENQGDSVDSEKLSCEEKKKEGVVFSWDADKKVCNEDASKNKDEINKDEINEDKKNEDKQDPEAGRIACEEKNTKWVNDVNNGTPAEKYRWDGKDCKDVKPAKEAPKKEKSEEASEQEEAASAPKRAPARFVPINIPSRQIYLMPGMP